MLAMCQIEKSLQSRLEIVLKVDCNRQVINLHYKGWGGL